MELTHFFRHYRFSKTSDCHPPNREFTSGWGSHQIRNDAEWLKVEFYKQGAL